MLLITVLNLMALNCKCKHVVLSGKGYSVQLVCNNYNNAGII